ncbi:hypothetical protein CP557_04630 [Natrinema ejinorense]|uniref:Uncharacterized protein n=1 Tax=Natrinema ejinorense TaxID=373386 RepID=A0A2A5QSU6_9EURY|nr:hypothetical protein CP557_04630 [Natrinema ejinorense]
MELDPSETLSRTQSSRSRLELTTTVSVPGFGSRPRRLRLKGRDETQGCGPASVTIGPGLPLKPIGQRRGANHECRLSSSSSQSTLETDPRSVRRNGDDENERFTRAGAARRT